MNPNNIAAVRGVEILDSRGNPTVRVTVTLESGLSGTASVPSGASTGEREAIEIRDGDPARFGGKGVRRAIENVETEIASAVIGRDVRAQPEIDATLVELDGTPNKSRLGANALLGVSMASACAASIATQVPLYEYLRGDSAIKLPVPMMNVINGGRHADSSLDFQEFMIVPAGASTFAEALRLGSETYSALRTLLTEKGHATAVGDEGGFAPRLASNEEACQLIVAAIERAGFRPGEDIYLALDPAATSFYNAEYVLARSEEGSKTAADMIELYRCWIDKYPILSIEDGLAENDWTGFREMTAELGSRIQIVGDDIYVTNTAFLQRGIDEDCSNAALIKLNQIGTVSETIAAIELCQRAGWNYVISHRSGETEDTFIADFAVAMAGGQIKAGAPCRGERVAKYNRLLAIENELGSKARFASPYAKDRTP